MKTPMQIASILTIAVLVLSFPGTAVMAANSPNADAAAAAALLPKAVFLGEYSMNHDGWKGTLTLMAAPDDYHADYLNYPNITGTYVGGDGIPHDVRGYVRTATYMLPVIFGPDHAVHFYIDFADTADPADDQEFRGYLFTQVKEAIAGTTTWGGTTFSFYAVKIGGPDPVEGFLKTYTLPDKDAFLGVFRMNHDGWKGSLRLWGVPDDPTVTLPNIAGVYTGGDGIPHAVRGFVRTPTYDLPLAFGPDHRIVFYIDFPDTADTTDDLMFEGYLFTQTKGAIAGVTYWGETEFGFYAIANGEYYLPTVSR